MRLEKDLGLSFISSQTIAFLSKGTRDFVINKILIMLIMESDLQTYKKAITSKYSTFWNEAMNDEMD